MFKYIKYTKVETEFTVLEFRGQNDDVKVNHFNTDVVSIEAESESDIDELIASQPSEIGCEEITHTEFRELVNSSLQLARIRNVVADKVAQRYTISNEIALSRLDNEDPKKIAYEEYVNECVAYGIGLKLAIGY